MNQITVKPVLTKKDFMSDQEVRWCPGCGDYAILSAIQKTLPTLGIPKENIAIISGIGCSSRFPYYMDTYGFHTIHGRAPAVATGLKLANPELSVWVITGDGDSLSIGGNHLIHVLRRNVNLNIVMFNNEIYGLTKGQFSPTSQPGTVSKSTPFGSVDRPFHPLQVALGARAGFVARVSDTNLKHMSEVFAKAHAHKGTSFIEVYQNCIIFNDGVFDQTTGKEHRNDNMLYLEEGEPLLFGKDKSKGIALDCLRPTVSSDPRDPRIPRHDPTQESPLYAQMLVELSPPEFPEVFGILRAVESPVYEEQLIAQEEELIQRKGRGTLEDVLHSGDLWEVS